MNPEQEGGMAAEGMTTGWAGGVAAAVLAVLSAIGWLWKQRQERPRNDAEQSAGIARSQMDEAAAQGMRAAMELVRQELQTHAAELNDLRQQHRSLREQSEASQAEVLRLRGELQRVQTELDSEKAARQSENRRATRLQLRVETLEREIRKHGLELPR